MDPLSTIQPLYSFMGFLVGMLVGLTGTGGGSLMTPLLVLMFGVHPQTAVGTDLLYAAITKGVGTAIHGISHTVDWRITARLASGSLPATFLTLFALFRLGAPSDTTAHVISFTLGIALLLTALSLIFRKYLVRLAETNAGVLSPKQVAALTVATGAVLGVLVSLSSVGAGALGVTALILLYPRLPTSRIVGSDIAHAVPLTLVAGLGHLALGAVNWMMLGSLLVGSIPGIILGSFASARVPDRVLRPVLAATLIIVGGKLVS